MIKIYVVLAMATLGSAAAAQTAYRDYGSSNKPVQQAGNLYIGDAKRDAWVGAKGVEKTQPRYTRDGRQCLREKKSGKVTCLDRAGWKAIAAAQKPASRAN